VNIADLLNHAATEIERKRIELAYLMGKVDGKQEVIDTFCESKGENEDE
jgi:hypothetical protein